MNTKIFRKWLLLLLGSASTAPSVFGQATVVNLSTQGRNPDFSAMPVTRPVTVGTSLPATCIVGQLFFNSSVAAGTNLSACTAANTWSPLGTGVALPLSVSNGGSGTSTPSLLAGSNVTVTGSWPNQTISAAAGGSGSAANATAIQGAAVSTTAPANNQTLIYYGAVSAYVPSSIYTLQNGLGTAAVGATNLQVNVSMGIRAVTTTSDTIVSTDCGGLITYNNAAPVAVALPQPALGGNFLAGCPVTFRNYGVGAVTLTPSASSIGGNVSQAVTQNKACLVVSDGVNWQLGNCN